MPFEARNERSRAAGQIIFQFFTSPRLTKNLLTMYYVYLIRSKSNPDKTYIGYTTDLDERLKRHNEGRSFHTKENLPWVLVASISLDSKAKALSLERYLKVGSGHAFAKKRLW